MATKWVVTTASDHIVLDDSRKGETTFTVTNPTSRGDQAVFDIVTDEGADPSWFSVDEPQRRVPANGSVSYLMRVAIPGNAPAGDYSVQGRAYSADSAPEEDSVLSKRLAVALKPVPVATPKRRPWWLLVVAGLVVIVLVVVGILVFGGDDAPPPPPATQQAVVPDLAGQSEGQAKTNLAVFGLSVGTVRHKQDNTPGRVIYQSVAGGSTVDKHSKVDLVVTVALAAPKITGPKSGSTVSGKLFVNSPTPVPTTPTFTPPKASPSHSATNTPSPSPSASATAAPGVLRWSDSDTFVTRWQVTVQRLVCISAPIFGVQCGYVPGNSMVVDTPSSTPLLEPGRVQGVGSYALNGSGSFRFQVAPLDDFGNLGVSSGWSYFVMAA